MPDAQFKVGLTDVRALEFTEEFWKDRTKWPMWFADAHQLGWICRTNVGGFKVKNNQGEMELTYGQFVVLRDKQLHVVAGDASPVVESGSPLGATGHPISTEPTQAWKDATKRRFELAIEELIAKAHGNAISKGLWDDQRNPGEVIALMHSELSEALEALRNPGPDKHCPQFDGVVVELADVLIRIFDFAGGAGLPLAQALTAKMEFNQTRPHKHGRAF